MKEGGFQFLKSFTSKIHPPLPRTSRQSKQLLDVVSTSFRRQLDKEHPPIQSEETRATTSSNDAKSNSASSATPTDKHMSSILQHPLFSPPKPAASASPRTLESRDRRATGPPLDDPFFVLDKALAAGTANVETLRQCIQAHWFSMLGLSDVELREKTRTSGVSQRIESWLLSSTPSERRRLFGDRRTVALMMPYLACENRRDTVINWLARMRSHAPGHDQLSIYEENVISEFVAAEIKFGGHINGALDFYSALHSEVSGAAHRDILAIYLPMTDSLAREIISDDHRSGVCAQSFHKFQRLHKTYRESAYLWGAFFPVFHPVSPRADAALDYLKSQKYKLTPLLCQLSLATAELCIKQERIADATWLIKHTQQLIPSSISQTTPSTRPRRERLSLDEITRRLAPTPG